ncbi:hypothetical protein LCGC14_1244080 [marine sediment metagenome]|uniref:Tyr recombinase domain-containing protein n=1 Tax=marine sediment metagenome TaxID=412755 RepID=A0A0F9NM92_9ZZZZ
MLEKLFKYQGALTRHKNAPFFEERERYLSHRASEGYAQTTLIRISRELFWVANYFQSDEQTSHAITPEEIRKAADNWARKQHRSGRAQSQKWSRELFVQVSTDWFQFLGRLQEPVTKPPWYKSLIEDFATFMECERGLSSITIRNECWQAEQFLHWYQSQDCNLSSVRVSDVDRFFITYGKERWSRVSMASSAKALRAFFRHAEMRNWSNSNISESIQRPRLFAQENLPMGPSWDDVRRLFDSMKTKQPSDIRDSAIIMFFAIYGMRSSEVANLRLEEIDWENNQIKIIRKKQRRSQVYPLIPEVGNALIRYLQLVRPRCRRRTVFLTLRAPIKPLSISGLYNLVNKRIKKLGIRTLHRGPHAVRHACATHLVSEGLSLKEIGDHLGHRSTSATRIYAKVDLPNLREVAEFNYGGAL